MQFRGAKVIIRDGDDPDDIKEEIHQAWLDLQEMKRNRGTDGFTAQLCGGGRWKVQSHAGVDTIFMLGKPVYPGKKKEKVLKKDQYLTMPVPAYDVYNEDYDFLGFYVNPGYLWNKPLYKFSTNPPFDTFSEAIYRSGIEEMIPQGLTKIELYLLPEIGENDLDDYDYDSDTSQYYLNGSFSPGADWSRPIELQGADIAGNTCAWVMGPPGPGDPSCIHGTDSTGIAYIIGHRSPDQYYFMVNSYNRGADVYTGGIYYCNANEREEVWGMVQTYSRVRSANSWSSISMPGAGDIASGSVNWGSRITGTHNGWDCSSESELFQYNEGSDVYTLASSTVRDAEDYDYADDSCWCVLYRTYDYSYYSTTVANPWHLGPYWGEFEPADQEYTGCRYFARVHTPDYDMSFEFTSPEYGYVGGPEGSKIEQVYVYQDDAVRIFDYHGEPVFVFTWTDERDDSSNYGMVYRQNYIKSAPLPRGGSYYEHSLPNLEDVFEGGLCITEGSAVGLRRTERDTINITTIKET